MAGQRRLNDAHLRTVIAGAAGNPRIARTENPMETLRRIVCLLFRPTAEWDLIAKEETAVDVLVCRYILPLALLAPVATGIGMTTFDRAWDPVHGYLVPADRILATGVITYLAIVGSIFVLAAILSIIAPMYGGARGYRAALKVATYGAIPVLLAGATLLLPAMAIVGLVGFCHTLFLYWLGAKRVLKVSAGEGAEFIAIVIVVLTLVSVLVGVAAGTFGLL